VKGEGSKVKGQEEFTQNDLRMTSENKNNRQSEIVNKMNDPNDINEINLSSEAWA
jgi:hypothetical protein